jgi:hypothetical protein
MAGAVAEAALPRSRRGNLWRRYDGERYTITVFRRPGSCLCKWCIASDDYHPRYSEGEWAEYNGFRRRQFCWSHLRRDFQAMIDRQNSGAASGKKLLDLSDRMFAWWYRVRDGTLGRPSFQVYITGLRADVREALSQGATCDCPQTAATCRELIAHEPKLWAFVWNEGVEPTNKPPSGRCDMPSCGGRVAAARIAAEAVGSWSAS